MDGPVLYAFAWWQEAVYFPALIYSFREKYHRGKRLHCCMEGKLNNKKLRRSAIRFRESDHKTSHFYCLNQDSLTRDRFTSQKKCQNRSIGNESHLHIYLSTIIRILHTYILYILCWFIKSRTIQLLFTVADCNSSARDSKVHGSRNAMPIYYRVRIIGAIDPFLKNMRYIPRVVQFTIWFSSVPGNDAIHFSRGMKYTGSAWLSRPFSGTRGLKAPNLFRAENETLIHSLVGVCKAYVLATDDTEKGTNNIQTVII